MKVAKITIDLPKFVKNGWMYFKLKNKIRIKISKTTSLENDCQGVSGSASPKQPQSVTLLKYAE